MQIEIGKTYLNREGTSIKVIMLIEGMENGFIGQDLTTYEDKWLSIDTYYPNGAYLDDQKSIGDLMVEVTTNNVVSL